MTTLATLALGFGNYGMGWIVAGQILLYPIVGAMHLVTTILGGNIPYSDTLVIVPTSSYRQINVLPSTWFVQVSYFFSYLFFNARDIYLKDPIDSDSDYTLKVNNRKARTMIIMITSVIFLLLLVNCRLIARSELSGSPFITIMSIILSLGVGISGAYVWSHIGKQPNVGTGYLDVFGISQQMILIPKTNEKTMCEGVNL